MQKINYKEPFVFKTPVLFLVFNRLDTTKKVFNKIRDAKPPRLYISSDGAREQKQNENEKVVEIRKFLIENIDWNCEVKTLFNETNLGCKLAVSNAINWFFKNEEQGIILEDDCLPNTSFFIYCQNLLEKYKNDKNVFLISGDGRVSSKVSISNDYCFTKYPMIWGWASWSRVWEKYDVNISNWKDNNHSFLNDLITNKKTKLFWVNIFNKLYNNQIDTWDFQFVYLLLQNKANCIVPKYNLISNIGFGQNATHTSDKWSENSNISSNELTFPLKHIIYPKDQEKVDNYLEKYEFSEKSFLLRLKLKLRKFINIILSILNR